MKKCVDLESWADRRMEPQKYEGPSLQQRQRNAGCLLSLPRTQLEWLPTGAQTLLGKHGSFFFKSYWIVCIFLLTLPIPPKTFTSRKLLPHITESRTELDKVFPFILSFAKDFDQDCSLSPWRFAAVVTDFFSFFLTFNIHFFVSTKTNKRAVLEGDADFQLLERSGIDLETVLSNLSSPQSYYRFSEAEV